jgi:hemerythrin
MFYLKKGAIMSVRTGLVWSDSYKIGNEKVDEQHYQLFEMINDFLKTCDEASEPKKLKDALSFLVNYTVQHFNDEEALQQECGYPHYEDHKKIHEDFKTTVGRLVQKFTDSNSAEDLKSDINKVVVTWLLNHVQRDDRKIGVYIQSQKGH